LTQIKTLSPQSDKKELILIKKVIVFYEKPLYLQLNSYTKKN